MDLVEAYVPAQKEWLTRARGIRPLWLGVAAGFTDASEGTAKMFVAGGTAVLPEVTVGGAKKWSSATGAGIDSSPAISADGSTVFVGSRDHSLYAFDAASGAPSMVG